MFSLKLKQAQLATSQGRLDEAFDIITKSDVLEHKDGKKLADKLGVKFLDRAGQHLEAETIEQALADCNKAAKLIGNTTELGRLRKAIVEAMSSQQCKMHQQQAVVNAARENIAGGWVSVGKGLLEGTNDSDGAVLLQNANAIRSRTNAVIEKAQKALDEGYAEEAIEIIRCGQCGKDIGLYSSQLLGRLRRDVCSKVRDDINIGRIDLAERMLDMLAGIEADSLESGELKSIVTECRKACGYIATGQLARASELFGKLRIVMPKAKWISEAANEAAKGAKAIEELRAGPLGLMTSSYKHNEEPKTEQVYEDRSYKRNAMMNNNVQSKFILHIDGVGSYLVVNNDKVTIGPVSSSSHCDVKVIAAADMQEVEIERCEGDYFIKSKTPVGINNKAVTGGLLKDSDKIALSNRNRIKFRKANSASNTVELIPSGIRFIQAGLTSVLLMDREILIGPGGSNHIQTNEISTGVIIYFNNGCLMCRSQEYIVIDGVNCGNQCAIDCGKQIEIGTMTLTVTSDIKG